MEKYTKLGNACCQFAKQLANQSLKESIFDPLLHTLVWALGILPAVSPPFFL